MSVRQTTRRRGARAARGEARPDGVGKGPSRAVWPGMVGGRSKPLSEEGIRAVNDTAFRILEEVGLRDATPRCVATLERAGGRLTADDS